MAGKRMKLNLDMPVMSYTATDRKTLNSWQRAFDKQEFATRLKLRMQSIEIRVFSLAYTNKQQICELIALVAELDPDVSLFRIQPRTATPGNTVMQPVINSWTEGYFVDSMTVKQAAEVMSRAGADNKNHYDLFWLYASCYRAAVQGLAGPIPGFSSSVTIAGIVAVALSLGLEVDFDS